MPITLLAGNVYRGTSLDIKPIVTDGVTTGSRFIEEDTAKIFVWTGTAWAEIPVDHANLLPPDIHVPYNSTPADDVGRIGATYAASEIGKLIWQQDTKDFWVLTGISPNTFDKVSGSGSGEPNTASNVGVTGIGLFDQKVGVDLQLYNLDEGSSKVILYKDVYNKVILIDIDQDEIDADALKIDYSPSNYTPTAPTDELASHLEGIDSAIGSLAANLCEDNTASNYGVSGIGWYHSKSGVDLRFKNALADDGALLIEDVPNRIVKFKIKPDVTTGGDVASANVVANGVGVNVRALDGDHLEIDYVPNNYTPDNSISEATSTKDAAAHFAGINNKLGELDLIDNGNKFPVRLATVVALPAYTPNGSGVGKFLQANANGTLTVDGIGVVTGNRILVKNEIGAAQVHNGVYTVTNPGDGSNKYVLTRSIDYDQSGEIIAGHLISASEGGVNADNTFILTTNAPIAIESSYLIYANANTQGITSQTTIAPSANVAVDSILLSATHAATWIIDIYDATAGNREASMVTAREENLSALGTQYAVVGDTIAYSLSYTSDGTSMLFKVQNNESNSIIVRVRKFEV